VLRERVRPQWSDEELARIYAGAFDQRMLGWGGDARVVTSGMIGKLLLLGHRSRPVVVDLAAGNGAIASDIARTTGGETLLGDFAPGFTLRGPIESTIIGVRGDMLVCCETLEHLWDPDLVLRKARDRFAFLVVSVPLWEHAEQEQNGEHYWAFDREGAEAMLTEAGWVVQHFAEVPAYPVGGDGGTYQCGIWGCV
jgi:hypothetical protein